MRAGKPFSGTTGKLLWAVCDTVGFQREEVWTTNLLCWRKESPTEEEIRACMPRLSLELKIIQPKLIVALGSIVHQVLNQGSFGKLRGVPMWSTTYNCWVMTTFHPSAIVRGGHGLIHDLYRDIKKIPDVVTWPQNRGDIKHYVVN